MQPGHVFRGGMRADGCTFGLVVSRFNSLITQKLLDGACETLVQHGAAQEALDVAWVPGAFEIPLVARRLALTQRYQAVLCLGALIRGATPHFDWIASAVAHGMTQVALETQIPVIFGVLTTESLEQALERAGGKGGHKGAEAALAAIEMAQLLRSLPEKAGL